MPCSCKPKRARRACLCKASSAPFCHMREPLACIVGAGAGQARAGHADAAAFAASALGLEHLGSARTAATPCSWMAGPCGTLGPQHLPLHRVVGGCMCAPHGMASSGWLCWCVGAAAPAPACVAGAPVTYALQPLVPLHWWLPLSLVWWATRATARVLPLHWLACAHVAVHCALCNVQCAMCDVTIF